MTHLVIINEFFTNEILKKSMIEFINALAGLWPLALIGVFTVVIYRTRGITYPFLERLFRKNVSTLKAGTSGVELNFENDASVKPEQLTSGPEIEKSEEVLLAESIPSSETLELANKDEDFLQGSLVELAFGSRDLVQMQEIFEEMQSIQSDQQTKLKDKAFYFYLRVIAGDVESLQNLKSLAENPEVAFQANKFIAFIYDRTTNVEEAILYFEKALGSTDDEKEKSQMVVLIALQILKTNRIDEAFARLIQAINTTEDKEALTDIYKGLAEFYKQTGENEFRLLALEKAVELRPLDNKLVFSLAYAYGENNKEELAWLTYQAHLTLQPSDPWTLNNLGVVYHNLNMQLHGIRSYKKASKNGNTLASANLASKLIQSGFGDEARKYLDEEKLKPDADINIAKNLTELESKEETEKELRDKIENLAIRQKSFLRNFASHFFTNTQSLADLNGKWEFESGFSYVIDNGGSIVQNGLTFEGEWNHGILKISGKITNSAMQVTIKETDKSHAALAFPSADGKTLHVMMKTSGDNQFWQIKRFEDAGRDD